MVYFDSSSTNGKSFVYSSNSANTPNSQNQDQEQISEIQTAYEIVPFSQEEYGSVLLAHYLQDSDADKIFEDIGVSVEDEKFNTKIFEKPHLLKTNKAINQYINEQINNSISMALEEDLSGAYNAYLKLSSFSQEEVNFIYSKEGENMPTKLPEYIEKRLRNQDSASTALKIIKNLANMNNYIAHAHGGAHTPINPYLTISNLEEFSNKLPETQMTKEQKAKMYFLSAQMFKERSVYGIETFDKDGIHYLEKAVSFSSNHNLISNSMRNLNKKYDHKNMKDAYNRALEKATKEKDYNSIYSIHKKIITIYEDDRTIGYYNSHAKQEKVEQHHKLAIVALKKTINHSKEDVNNELRKLFEVQVGNGNINGAIKSKEEIAGNLKGKDKYNALISILGIAKPDRQLHYVNKISTLISNDKMNPKDKNELLKKLLSETQDKVSDTDKKEKGIKTVESKIVYNNLFITRQTKGLNR
ncbi:MAG: hypothetical protein ACK5N8_09015 [Alphaproteobacteria bacterium]